MLLRRISDRLNVPMAILALVWVLVITVELTNIVPPVWLPLVERLDAAIWIVFLAEFLLELWISPRKIEYVTDNWITALSVLLPFFGILRLLRALVALRALSLARVVLGANRATRGAAAILGKSRLFYVVAFVAVVALVGAAAVSFFERGVPNSPLASLGEALWWSATLVTTINIGLSPVTLEGRIIAMLLRTVGLSLFGYLTASIASYLVGADSPAGTSAERSATGQAEQMRMLEDIQSRLREVQACIEGRHPPQGGDGGPLQP